jgi:hypothetical protein
MPLHRDRMRDDDVVYQPLTGDLVPRRRLVEDWHLRSDGRAPTTAPSHRGDHEVRAAASSPRNHKVTGIRDLRGERDVYCLTVPEAGNFALEAGVFVRNCGVIVNVTPLEPEWHGVVTIEISNTTPLPAKIYAGEGIAQVLFFLGNEVCETSYADRKGKYQDQAGLTLPKIL